MSLMGLVQAPLHEISSTAQLVLHMPIKQRSEAEQALPHPPQLARSLVTSTQLLPHNLKPLGQSFAQVPLPQTRPVGHTLLHAPQLFGSLVVSVHWPLQLVCGAGQPHAPALQVSLASQVVPHLPQLAGSICELMQRPAQT